MCIAAKSSALCGQNPASPSMLVFLLSPAADILGGGAPPLRRSLRRVPRSRAVMHRIALYTIAIMCVTVETILLGTVQNILQ
jgi:hypothetical protein